MHTIMYMEESQVTVYISYLFFGLRYTYQYNSFSEYSEMKIRYTVVVHSAEYSVPYYVQ